MNIHVYKFITDAGHGWLAVPRQEVETLGLEISHYSYQDNETGMVYLEEDCDAAVFIDAKENLGHKIQFHEIDYPNDCFIRNLDRYEATDD